MVKNNAPSYANVSVPPGGGLIMNPESNARLTLSEKQARAEAYNKAIMQKNLRELNSEDSWFFRGLKDIPKVAANAVVRVADGTWETFVGGPSYGLSYILHNYTPEEFNAKFITPYIPTPAQVADAEKNTGLKKLKETTEPDTAVGQFVARVAPFVTGYLGAARGMTAVGLQATTKSGMFAKDITAGAISDFTMTSYDDGTISDLVKGTWAENAVTRFFETGDDAGLYEIKAKATAEGGVLGFVLSTFVDIVRAMRKVKTAKDYETKVAESPDGIPRNDNGDAINKEGGVIYQAPEPKVTQDIKKTNPKAKVVSGRDFKKSAKNVDWVDGEDVQNALTARSAAETKSGVNHPEGIPLDEIETIARDLGISADYLANLPPNSPLNIEQFWAARRYMQEFAEQIKAFALKNGSWDPENPNIFHLNKTGDAAEYHAIYEKIKQLTALRLVTRGATQQAGLILRANRKDAVPEPGLNITLAEATDNVNQAKGVEKTIVEFMQNTKTAESDAAALAKANEKGFAERVQGGILDAYRMSILSSPPTHIINFMGNAWTAVLRPLELQVSTIVGYLPNKFGAKHFGDERVTTADTVASIKGSAIGAWRGLSYIKMLYNNDVEGIPDTILNSLHHSKDETTKSGNFSFVNKDAILSGAGSTAPMPNKWNQGFADYMKTWGKRVGYLPADALMVADLLFKSIQYESAMYEYATRAARINRIKRARARHEGLPESEWPPVVTEQQLMKNPPAEMMEHAKKIMEEYTFTRPLEHGTPSFYADRLLDSYGGLPGRLVMPFFRTPVNLAAFQTMRDPIFGPLIGNFTPEKYSGIRRQFKREMQANPSVMYGRVGTSVIITGAVAGLVADGRITGSFEYMTDAEYDAARVQGMQEYSILVNGKWVSYQNADPLALPLGLAADGLTAYQRFRELHADPDDSVGQILYDMTISRFALLLIDKAFLGQVNDLMDAITSDNIHGEKAPELVSHILAGFVPNIIDDVSNMSKEYVQNTSHPETGKTIAAKPLKKLGKGFPIRLNVFGEKIKQQSGPGVLLSNVWVSEDEKDADIQYMGKVLGWMPDHVHPSVQGLKLEDPADKTQLIAYTTKPYWRPESEHLKPLLKNLINRPGFKRLPYAEQIEKLKLIMTKLRDGGRMRFLADRPDIMEKVKEQRRQEQQGVK